MQVYSGWPQLVKIRSSTTWYVAILVSWVEKEDVKSVPCPQTSLTGGQKGRHLPPGPTRPPPPPQASTEMDSEAPVFSPRSKFPAWKQRCPRGFRGPVGAMTPNHIKMVL